MEEIIICIIETVIIAGYFTIVLGGDKRTGKKRLIGALIVVLLTSFLNVTDHDSTQKGIITMLILIIYAYTCFGQTAFERLFYGASYALIAVISDQITFRAAGLFQIKNLEILLTPGQVRYSMIFIYFLSSILIILFISFLRKKPMTLPFFFQIPLLIVFTGVLIGLDNLLDLMIFLKGLGGCESMVNLVKFISVLLPAVFFVSVFMVVRLARTYYERNELKDRQRLDQLALKEYGTIKESAEALRGWRHDMRSHLNTIFKLIEEGENHQACEYITRIYGEMNSGIILVNSGNQILDAVISAKAMKARNSSICFDYKIYPEYEIPLSPSEMTSLFGNILNNAIEACQEAEEGRKRYIFLEIKTVNQMIHIAVENACRSGIRQVGDVFPTTKGEGHGIGLSQVKRIVQKHEGFLTYDVTDTCFKILIYLPAGKEEK